MYCIVQENRLIAILISLLPMTFDVGQRECPAKKGKAVEEVEEVEDVEDVGEVAEKK